MLPEIIEGGSHTDQRGTITFLNNFDMAEVKRFYVIQHPEIKVIRGWRAHKIEQRWFHVTEGEFLVRLIKIDNWDAPSKTLPVVEFRLSAARTEVLHIPIGYANSIQAIVPNSKLIVFADYGIENAKIDDYLYPLDHFEN